MARPATGHVKVEAQSDGTLCFRLRFPTEGGRETVRVHERRDCDCGCGGGWNERTAKVELQNILARVQAGIWEKPANAEPDEDSCSPEEIPTFRDYADYWLEAKRDGVLGAKPLRPATYIEYRARLRHLQPFFGRYRLDEIDRGLCLEFKARKIAEANELREALGAGADLRDERGRRPVPLGPSSIRRLVACLTAIFDEAIEDGHIAVNPARSRRLRVHVPKPKRTFLEIDELVRLEEAAGDLDPSLASFAQAAREARRGSTRAAVAARLAEGMTSSQIAEELQIPKGTLGFHLTRLGGGGRYVGRRAIVCTLGRSGVRVSELCDMRIGHLRLHDPSGARFQIPDAKTEKGIREVEMSPELVEELVMHLDRVRRGGADVGPEAHVFQNGHGGRTSRHRVGKLVGEAAEHASERLRAEGLPPLPHISPHSLRRTYISIALLANNFDVLWVMNQVGHADSKMTLDVYAQLQQRAKREHGASFDRLVQAAREQLRGDAQAQTVASPDRGGGLGGGTNPVMRHDRPSAEPSR